MGAIDGVTDDPGCEDDVVRRPQFREAVALFGQALFDQGIFLRAIDVQCGTHEQRITISPKVFEQKEGVDAADGC